MTSFSLPRHSSCRSIDPLGLCEDVVDPGDGTLPHANLIEVLLKQADAELRDVEALPSFSRPTWTTIFSGLVEDIAYGLHLDSSLQTGGLEIVLKIEALADAELSKFRKSLISSAMSLEVAFPTRRLQQLCDEDQSISLRADQFDCLLAYLLLGTIHMPSGNTWGRPGYTQLFGGSEATAETSQAYLLTIMQHFSIEGYSSTLSSDHHFTFQLSSGMQMPELSISNIPAVAMPVTVVDKPCDPSSRQTASSSGQHIPS